MYLNVLVTMLWAKDTLMSKALYLPRGGNYVCQTDDLRWITVSKLLVCVMRKRKGSKPFVTGYYTGMGRGSLSDITFGFPLF